MALRLFKLVDSPNFAPSFQAQQHVHFLFAQTEVKHFKVRFNPLRGDGFRDDNVTSLYLIPYQDLSWSFFMFMGDALYNNVVHRAWRAGVDEIRRSQRAVRSNLKRISSEHSISSFSQELLTKW